MTRTHRRLSELEGVCLGIVRLQQPCTAYRVRQELKDAPSSHWHASAGSVYPLLSRLQDEGLVNASEDAADGRGKQLLRISPSGRSALKQWITAGAEIDYISSVADPIRSRTFFLDVLSAAERTRYLDDVIEATSSYLEVTAEKLERAKAGDDHFDYLGCLGAYEVTKARLTWLRKVKLELE